MDFSNLISLAISGSIVVGITYFTLGADLGYWICTGIYALVCIFMKLLIVLLLSSMPGASIGISTIVSLIIEFVFFFVIGMGVVYIMSDLKETEEKTAISVGVVAHVISVLVLESIISSIFG